MKWKGIELHIGDRVRLIDERPALWSQKGRMDIYLGRIVTIENIYDDFGDGSFTVKKDYGDIDGGWLFSVNDIVEIVSTRNHANEIYTSKSYNNSLCNNVSLSGPTAQIKIGNLTIDLTDKTFTNEQIKNMKEMLGWDVANLVEV